MMDYFALLYLAAFPVLTVAVGWSILARGLLASDDKLAMRRVQRWRFVFAFVLFAVAWLLLVSAGLVTYARFEPVLSRDILATVALIAGVVWLGCTAYWLALLYSAEDMLYLPQATARRTASSALLWNLILTVPFFAIAVPSYAEPMRLIAGV